MMTFFIGFATGFLIANFLKVQRFVTKVKRYIPFTSED